MFEVRTLLNLNSNLVTTLVFGNVVLFLRVKEFCSWLRFNVTAINFGGFLLIETLCRSFEVFFWVQVASLQLREPTPHKTLYYINCFVYLLFWHVTVWLLTSLIQKKCSFSWATWAHRVALISVSIALSQAPAYTERDHRYRSSISRGVPAYSPAFAGTEFSPTLERWPGWVKLGGWLTYQDGANATLTCKQLLIPV